MTKEKLTELLRPIKIVKMLSIEKHPDADRLFVTRVTDGTNEYQVVTGVDNMKVGDFVPYLGVGSVVPGFLLKDKTEITLTKKPLRGIESEGMILAEDEIGMSGDHGGIVILNTEIRIQNTDEAKVLGMSMIEVLPEIVEKTMKFNNFVEMTPGIQKKVDLVKNNLEEIIGEDELISLIANGEELNHYIGFEISGLVHLGTGLSSMLKIKDMQEAGANTTVWLADWHTWINDKLGGDHDLIRRVSKEYFQPALEISAKIVGADPSKVIFKNGTDIYHNNDRYWQTVIEISKNLTLSRVLKSTSIMGRDERESQPFAWLIYPPMQAADIMELQTNIVHAGMDQRKIHVITREVAKSLKINPLRNKHGESIKPVAIHHHLLMGLQAPTTWPIPEGESKDIIRTQMKMSKSVPGSAIFIHDSEEEVKKKINNAFCPEKEVDFNPILDWTKHVIFPILAELNFERDVKYGGSFTCKSFDELAERYSSGDLYPLDLKNNIANILAELLKPARERFSNKDSLELIDLIKGIKKTR